ncbi:MAG: hypothetical protein A3I11_00315 [Elusimicrobia bacterium RIFCSPLOWO2_02_FULL_39_32]|nr:MAG: hypothetical protein A2034_01980 [Elusimicrobia bacterium GWA2_38_7]OGR81306.1 MAG: hypothetical protein A3B80_03475 [Elusimicrobia bacterium RIFCSPHIGHO2_02_FULL_39_36]OGR91419.1 MAG: hypothetical protein A3I11_00315 [Elusimicrobia bacterium RIFCSPLOWO2_02_FULL_39_32]OGR98534.1 MAG: hypothetical protein A3G85_07255 [Elusimicrobia bacterium RIFCSPLOWO2_12_FULL_39_28]
MLLPRFLTALIGIPLLLISIWWGQIPFLILTFGIILLSLYEYYSLLEEAGLPVFGKVGILCGSIFSLGLFLAGTKANWVEPLNLEKIVLPLLITLFFLTFTLAAFFYKNRENAFFGIALTWLPLFYIVWPFSHLFLLRNLRPDGKLYTFFLFFIIWSLDIGAYIGGKQFGKKRLSEFISPKKTWEGAFIGSLLALISAVACKFTFLNSLTLKSALLLGFIILILAQSSDLSESLLKRNLKIKDSGSLLPGHGGILDRFDSFLLTTPIVYYILVIFIIK